MTDPGDLAVEYRRFLRGNVPAQWRERSALGESEALDVQRSWLRTLTTAGWGAPHWPREHGGRDATLAEQIELQHESALADAPSLTMFGMALVHAACTILEHGSQEQRHRHLPAILAGDEIWCQGFSEPDAGSDLASLRTVADLRSDHYVVRGQKVWSSGAHRADRCMLLARTEAGAAPHRGISYLLVDMKTPGIEVRPIVSMLGSAEFCEIFLDDVVVPLTDRLGAPGEGWQIAQTTLSTERGLYLLPVVNELREELVAFADLVARADPGLRAVAEQVLGRHHADIAVLGALIDEVLAAPGTIESNASLLKVIYSEIAQRMTGDALAFAGPCAQEMWDPTFEVNAATFDGNWARSHYWSWAWTIAGGTNEIQRNLIVERILGLPREPKVLSS